jgi:hypothetical protein
MCSLVSTEAQATSFDTYMRNVYPGFKSRSWTDDGGTGDTLISFTNCYTDSPGALYSTNVILWHAYSAWPDTNKGEKVFTACTSGGKSTGHWPAMSKGDTMHFSISEINGQSGTLMPMNVDSVTVAY